MKLIVVTNKVSIGFGIITAPQRIRWLFVGWRGVTFIGWDWIPHGYYGIKYRPDQVCD